MLSEATATKQTRKARAQGLQVLGSLFQQAALAANANAPQVCLQPSVAVTWSAAPIGRMVLMHVALDTKSVVTQMHIVRNLTQMAHQSLTSPA